jgi:hypothetical protein
MAFSRTSRRAGAVLLLTLAGCHHAQQAERAPAEAPQRADTAADPGAPVLAAVLEARAAIAATDPVAALNDANLALDAAARLAGAQSALYPPEAAPPGYHDRSGGAGSGGGRGRGGHRHAGGGRGGGGALGGGAPSPSPTAEPAEAVAPAASGPRLAVGKGRRDHGRPDRQAGVSATPAASAGVSSFDAQVMLVSAQSRLLRRDTAGADAMLKALAAAPPAQAIPLDLSLIRAEQCLTLAEAAVSGGRIAELKTQLEAARANLNAYPGRAHAGEVRALAREIAAVLARPGGLAALQPAQLTLWSGRADGWVVAAA